MYSHAVSAHLFVEKDSAVIVSDSLCCFLYEKGVGAESDGPPVSFPNSQAHFLCALPMQVPHAASVGKGRGAKPL